jgi:signal transduction histidine kinase
VDAVELCSGRGWALAALALGVLGTVWAAALLHQCRLRAALREAQRTQRFERERSARQLHDSLLQGMHGLILRLQAVSDRLSPQDPAREGMEAALQRADQVLNEARDQVLALRQGEEPAGRLAAALAHVARELAGDERAQFRLQVEGGVRELAPQVHEELQHILTEALLNAFRHAQAHHIALTLHYGWRTWSASVVDDGVGMSADLVQNGRTGQWGLAGMRERAECVGAQLTLSSQVGKGTTVLVRLPSRRAYLRA